MGHLILMIPWIIAQGFLACRAPVFKLKYTMSKKKQSIFLSGAGGSGMSAIACLCLDRGMRVTGSDRAFDQSPEHPIARVLKTRGMELVPQDGSHPLADDSLMVASAAVEDDRPEVLTASSLGVPLMSRGEYLAGLTKEFRSLAVAGTSGKSTTSGMLAYAMGALGLDPAFIGGGRLGQFFKTAWTSDPVPSGRC